MTEIGYGRTRHLRNAVLQVGLRCTAAADDSRQPPRPDGTLQRSRHALRCAATCCQGRTSRVRRRRRCSTRSSAHTSTASWRRRDPRPTAPDCLASSRASSATSWAAGSSSGASRECGATRAGSNASSRSRARPGRSVQAAAGGAWPSRRHTWSTRSCPGRLYVSGWGPLTLPSLGGRRTGARPSSDVLSPFAEKGPSWPLSPLRPGDNLRYDHPLRAGRAVSGGPRRGTRRGVPEAVPPPD